MFVVVFCFCFGCIYVFVGFVVGVLYGCSVLIFLIYFCMDGVGLI